MFINYKSVYESEVINFKSRLLGIYEGDIFSSQQYDEYKLKVDQNSRYVLDIKLSKEVCVNIKIYDIANECYVKSITINSINHLLYVQLEAFKDYKLELCSKDINFSYSIHLYAYKNIYDISDIHTLKDRLEYRNQNVSYQLVASEEGTYEFKISKLNKNVNIFFNVFCINGIISIIDDDYIIIDGVNKGDIINVSVEEYDGLTPFTIHITKPVNGIDINNHMNVYDYIDYECKIISYLYTPDIKQNHILKFSNIMKDTIVEVGIYTTGCLFNRCIYKEFINNEFQNLYINRLNMNKTYRIEVRQFQGYTPFSFKILFNNSSFL